ncbi:MAG: hypothetical protein BWK76_09920 [Desulfobulbaceae bacterium A2]|nr:MAG: hypothetical protein BWK76_09920 [Desulfobulbaceae bacterium A2]
MIAEGICGRLDPGVANQIALDGIPGLNVIHSRHCRFTCREGVWYVMAIENTSKGYTNPTYVNNVMIRPGETRAIRHGDSLTLSGTTFLFRVVTP